METKMLAASDVVLAARLLTAGEIVIIPTETVYGLAANALDSSAVSKIFRAKGRPQDNPLIVHVSSIEMMEGLVQEVTPLARKLAERFWPGPLTIILPKTARVPDITSAGLDTVAIRMPSHPVARKIIEVSGLPLAAPSANLSGRPSPTTVQHCIDDMYGRVAAIVQDGPCDVGVESTVISLIGERPTLLRPGAVTEKQLREVTGKLDIHPSILEQLKADEKAASPGMKYKHYSPKAEVTMVEGSAESYCKYIAENAGPAVFALCFDEDLPNIKINEKISYGSVKNANTQAQRLFDCLRELDKQGAQTVFAHAPLKEGVGLAVYNRLLRACGFRVIKLK